MRVALVHDWLTGMRGGERCLDQFAAMFPDAPLYTLVHVPGSTSERIESRRIVASPLSRLPGIARHYRKALPLFPAAVAALRIEDCDLVLSSSHAVAKGVRTPPGAVHLCYCYTPMRYVWDQADAYLGTGLKRALASPLVASLRAWDRRTSGPERVQRFVAISRTVSARIRMRYGRQSDVVYPPVEVERFRVRSAGPEDFYLLVGGFVPYKREDIAIEAFGKLDRPLWVAGDGPGRARLEAGAPPNVRFLGRVSDEELADLYSRCRALLYPQDEDFGIVPVEAQAAGRPVICFGRGGATETVVPLGELEGAPPTGVWFGPQSADGLVAAVRRFEEAEAEFDPAAIRAHAQAFAPARFRAEIRNLVDLTLAGK